MPVSFFPSFFPLSLSIPEPAIAHFQSNLSIYFSFRFSPNSFYFYLFYFRSSIELKFSLNLTLFSFFNFQTWLSFSWLNYIFKCIPQYFSSFYFISDLVMIILIAICFVFNFFYWNFVFWFHPSTFYWSGFC